MTYKKPTIIDGNSIFDNRGSLTFVNKFNLKKIKRFYIIRNHKSKFIRIVTRLTHNLDCDENGVSYYLKPCKTCANCRKAMHQKKMKKKNNE